MPYNGKGQDNLRRRMMMREDEDEDYDQNHDQDHDQNLDKNILIIMIRIRNGMRRRNGRRK